MIGAGTIVVTTKFSFYFLAVISDHRLNCMALAMGFNTTRDEAKKLWNSTDLAGCIDELHGINKNYSKSTSGNERYQ